MSSWDARAEALLARARAEDRIPGDARFRVRAAVANSVALSAMVGASVSVLAAPTAFAKLPAAVKAANSMLPVGSAAVSTGTGGAAVLGSMAVGIALGLSAISPSQSTTAMAQPVATSAPSARALVAAPLVAASAMGTQIAAGEMARVRHSRNASPAIAARQPVVSLSLAEEAEALEHARLVLRQGDTELSLRLLDSYHRQYPNGVFAFEAAATRAEAMCRAGKNADGMKALRQIEAESPGAGVLARVRASCGVSRSGEWRHEQ